METEEHKKQIRAAIRMRLTELKNEEVVTSEGEPMSLAAIGRTLDPPVCRVTVMDVTSGKRKNQRVREAIEREMGKPFWIRRKES